MKIEKATWNTSADHLRLAMPLTKIDEEKRQVSGYASLDNADSHDDIVLAEASTRAFTRFRGNIREMHQPIAVGRMVDFKEDEYYDPKDQKFYKGIYVTVKISKGAQDTWEKVLDGTLTGFSIGGNVLDHESQFVKDAGKKIRFIKDYELVELSLVDNPANQLANVFSIEKTADGQIMKGMVADTKTEITYYCPEDEIAKTSTQESLECPVCDTNMVDVGWFEYTTDADKSEKMASLVQKYLSSNNTQETANNEGGVDVAEDTVKKQAVPEGQGVIEPGAQGQPVTEVESSVETEVAEVEEPKAEEVEEAADVSEVENAEDDLAKMFDTLREELKKDVAGNFETVNSTLDEVNTKFEKFSETVEGRFAELAEKHSELTEKFAGLKTELGNVEKSLSSVQSKTAFKKSGDLGGSTEAVDTKKSTSTWGGHFLGVDSLQD